MAQTSAPSPVAPSAAAGLSRRSVVRAGATAAWAAPVITLVTAAPAFAASGPARLTATYNPTPIVNGISTTVNVNVANSNNRASTAYTMVVTVTATAGSVAGLSASNATGYGAPSRVLAANNLSVTFSFVANTQVAANGTATFSTTISLTSATAIPGGTITISSDPRPGGAGTSVPAVASFG